MYDFHVHTSFSADSHTEMADMCEKAYEQGLQGLCFTDHVDLEYADPKIAFEFDYDKYKNEIQRQQKNYKDKLKIYCGVEMGLQPHVVKENTVYLEKKSYDFIIGSIHCAGKKELYGLDWIKELNNYEAMDLYFEDLKKCVLNPELYDVIGHLDVFRRYLHKDGNNFNFSNYKEKIKSILKIIISNEKGIEVNTSTLRYGLAPFHPLPEIISLYYDLGGSIITLGSDSHVIKNLGAGFDDAVKMLRTIGFTGYNRFENRLPIEIKFE